MANSKPYNNSKNRNSRTNKSNRTYNNKNNKNYKRNNNQNRNRQKSLDNRNLEHTTRIRIDEDRLNDFESLDTSFLGVRLEKNGKEKKKIKEQLMTEKKALINLRIVKRICLILGLLCVISLLLVVFMNINENNNIEKQSKVENEEVIKEEKVIDDNYLFVGGVHTKDFNFGEFDLDYHYVKVENKDYTTEDILEDMNNKIYRYNPSFVFLELGAKDLIEDKSNEEILENVREIIKNIKENRPYAKIVLESLYPIDKDNEDYNDDYKDLEVSHIKELNKEFKDLSKKMNVEYLDIYDLLNVDDKLSDVYSEDGFSLNDEAYREILKEVKRIVG